MGRKGKSLVTHKSPLVDSAKMSNLKKLVERKANAAIAGLGYCGVLYHTAWTRLVDNFGRHPTVVNSQIKLLHTYPFIRR